MFSRDIIEYLMGVFGFYVGGVIIEKDCSVLSIFLEVYIVNCMYSLYIVLLL